MSDNQFDYVSVAEGSLSYMVNGIQQFIDIEQIEKDRLAREKIKRIGRQERSVELVPASSIQLRKTRWLWDQRIPLGALTLVAGPEGVGKSTAVIDLAGAVTRGVLPGIYTGQPKGVVVVATEDSWEHTLAPRFLASGADMSLVFTVLVKESDGRDGIISIPDDIPMLCEQFTAGDIALLVLDPLMSRLDGSIDSHKDSDVRRGLEPLVAAADKARASVVGLIHLNKGDSKNPLDKVMGSKAFTAVARSVLAVFTDQEDKSVRILTHPKSNLGPLAPSLRYSIDEIVVGKDCEDGDPVVGSHVVWSDIEDARSAFDLMQEMSGSALAEKSALDEAREFLNSMFEDQVRDFNSCTIPAKAVKAAAREYGISESSLHRARADLRIEIASDAVDKRVRVWRHKNVWINPVVEQSTQTSATGRFEQPELDESA